MKKRSLIIFIWALFGVWTCYWMRIYTADLNHKKSQVSLKGLDTREALFYANKSIDLNPHEPAYYRNRAKVLTVRILGSVSSEQVKSAVLADLTKAIELNPENLVTIRNSVPIYYFLSINDMNRVSGVDNIDGTYLPVAKEFFSSVKRKYPHDVGVITFLAKYEEKLGLEEEYEESVGIVKNLRPELLEWHPSFR